MKNVLWCAVCAVSLVALGARAEEPKKKDSRPNLLIKGLGMEAEVGGGVQRFIDSGATSVMNTGGAWTARLIVGTRTHIAGEAAYVGTAQTMNALGLSDNAVLLSNGVEGAVRINVLTGDWQPYALAGYTWRRYTITNSAVNTSSVADAANVSEIPVAMGLAYRFKGLVADVRFGLHNAFSSSLLPQTNLSSFSVNGKVGFEF